jgi:formylglycine-generating enzyme required for sulfatase activity
MSANPNFVPVSPDAAFARAPSPDARPARDMVWIEGGFFLRGSDRHYPEERPKRRVHVDGFWIDRAPVTNADFAAFVEATGYRTLAERAHRGQAFLGAPSHEPVAGSMVFFPARRPVPLDQPDLWWAFVRGADWRHPAGPASSIAGLELHPVVHLALADVEAYCAWAGTGLPTEEEWEFAAKGGLGDCEFAWGDVLEPNGRRMANIWPGTFPLSGADRDGLPRTSPVGAYPANGFGLHDMIGNVWEWTADWWSIHPLGEAGKGFSAAKRRASAAPDDPLHIPRRVLKGGSHLCAPNHYRGYRPAARQPQPIHVSTSDIGLRCAMRPSRTGARKDMPTPPEASPFFPDRR